MPIDYKLGKVYKICSPQTDKCYVGSTAQARLCTRLAKHKSNHRGWLKKSETQSYLTSFQILQYDDGYIELLENISCNSKDELLVRERFWINTLDCVNKVKRPIVSIEEAKDSYRDGQARYYKKHKDSFRERSAKYYEDNKQKIIEQAAKYRTENKNKVRETHAKYYEKNKNRARLYREAHKESIKKSNREYRAKKKAEKEQKQNKEEVQTEL